ncbi:hypothetical protein [Rhodococcoides fascians]|nr:hypothetical protein [Rhodococcus fascians]
MTPTEMTALRRGDIGVENSDLVVSGDHRIAAHLFGDRPGHDPVAIHRRWAQVQSLLDAAATTHMVAAALDPNRTLSIATSRKPHTKAGLEFPMTPTEIAVCSLIVAVISLVATVSFQVHNVRKSRREVRERMQRHVEAVTVSPTHIQSAGEGVVRAQSSVTNHGDRPITAVTLWVDSQYVKPGQTPFTGAHTVEPGATLNYDELLLAEPDPYPVDGNDKLRANVGFTDSDGYAWQKWADGHFQSPLWVGPYRGRLPKRLMRVPLVAKAELRWRRRRHRPPTRQQRPPHRPTGT